MSPPDSIVFSLSSMTFTHYYSVWVFEMECLGFENASKDLPFKSFIQAWYAYLDLLDIDFEAGMTCSVCGVEPDVVICDGTSLGFQRKFLSPPDSVADKKVIPRYR